MTTSKRLAREVLEKIVGGPVTLSLLLQSIREGEEWSKAEMGRRLGVSRAHIGDIEAGRRAVSPERAARWAEILGYSPKRFVALALQQAVDDSGLEFVVDVRPRKVAKPRKVARKRPAKRTA